MLIYGIRRNSRYKPKNGEVFLIGGQNRYSDWLPILNEQNSWI